MLLEDCLNDIVDALPEHKHNDEISLIYESNKVNMVAVQMPARLTDRINIPHGYNKGEHGVYVMLQQH